MHKIFSEFTFDSEATQVATPLVEVLERRRGVCQDFAHLMLACLRSRGLAARYVSGYLLTQPPPGKPLLIGADASHAWVSVFCAVSGWVDFDPTNNVRPALEHITLAWGRDFSDVSPLRGVILGGGSHDPQVRVTVIPLEWRIVASKAGLLTTKEIIQPDLLVFQCRRRFLQHRRPGSVRLLLHLQRLSCVAAFPLSSVPWPSLSDVWRRSN